MTPAEQNAVDLLATRVAGGLNQMTVEQRQRFFDLMRAEFCDFCTSGRRNGAARCICRGQES